MNKEFAAQKMAEIADIAREQGDGFIAMYFARATKEFTGNFVGMTEDDAAWLIEQLIQRFNLDRNKMAELIRPVIIKPKPFEVVKPTKKP